MSQVEVVPPRAGDTAFQLWPQPAVEDAEGAEGEEAAKTNLVRAEELLRLHCATGSLSQRAVYLLLTFWRIADVESDHPQHPALVLDPEVQSPSRVFSALAAGVRGASHAALRWSSSALVDLCRCITSPVWERIKADAVEREDSSCRDAIARQTWSDLLVTILVNGVLDSTVTVEEALAQQLEGNDERGEAGAADEADGENAGSASEPVPEPSMELPGSLLDAHTQEQRRIREAVERRRKERATALRKVSESTSGHTGDGASSRWDGGAISHASYQSLYALRWLCRHDDLAKKVVHHADATRLLHFLAERALRPQRFSRTGCSCGRRFKHGHSAPCSDVPAQTVLPDNEDGDPDSQYWKEASASPMFEHHCCFCGLGTSQRLDDVFSVLATFMLHGNPETTELKGSLLCKLLDRAELLIDATRYMQEVSTTDYDEWQFGMMGALLPRVYDQGWVYASHGCEESSFVISAAISSDEGSRRAGEIIAHLLSNAEAESYTGMLSMLIALCRFNIPASRGPQSSQTFGHIILGLLDVMQPFIDLVDVNWSAIWFSSVADLLNIFEQGFFWAQNRVHPTDTTSLPPPRTGYFIAPTSSPAQIPAVLAAHALHKLAKAGVGCLGASEFERYAPTVLSPLLMGPNCAELCQLGFRTSGDQHRSATSMRNFERFCINSLETLASLGGNVYVASTCTVCTTALSTFLLQLLESSEGGYAAACFFHRIVVLARTSTAVPPAVLSVIHECLAEKEADIASCLLQTVVEAAPTGFLGMEDLHAGVAGLWWLVTADHVSLSQSFCSEHEVGPSLQELVQQFGIVVRLASSDGFCAPWLGSVMGEIIEAVVGKLGAVYGSSVLTDSPQHICDSLVMVITVCAELIVSSSSTAVSTNAKRRLAGPASAVLNSVLRVLNSETGQSALLDLGLVLPFSMFVSPLLKSMQGQVSEEEFAGGATELIGFIVQHDSTVSSKCCTLLAERLLTKPGSMNVTRSMRSLALAFAHCSGAASRQNCIDALRTVLEAGRHGSSNKSVLYPSGLLFNLRSLFHELQMDYCSPTVAARALQLFLDKDVGLLNRLLADVAAVEDTLVDADYQEDDTSILDVIRALMVADAGVVSSALLLQPNSIGTLVGLLVQKCHRANAHLQDAELANRKREPRRQAPMRVLLDIFHRLGTTQFGLDALQSNHEVLKRLMDTLAEIVAWPMYTGGVFSQSPWLAATLIARLAALPFVIQTVKLRPWLLRQARAVIVANAQPAVVAVARRSDATATAPVNALSWEMERLLWLGCLKQRDSKENSCCFSILPVILVRRIICHLCPVSRLLAPLYTLAGAAISDMIRRRDQARITGESSAEWTGAVDRYAKKLDVDVPVLSLETCVPRLMRCDAGPWALRTGVVCHGTLSIFDPVSRRGTIQLLPGEFATFDSTQLFLAAGRHGRLVLNQQLEFELEEISVDVVRGVFQAVRICRAGGGCVAYQPESSA